MSGLYRSMPLHFGDSTNIRVLKILHDATYRPAAPISCKVQVITLEDKSYCESQIPYTALSYTWGDPSPTRTVFVNRKPFAVRLNLWHFLDQMRKVHFQGLLWVDAVCIDQESNAERNHQVAMMGQIYSQAAGLTIWLGPGSDRPVRAMRALSDLVEQRKEPKDWVTFDADLRAFCHEKYWTRVWM
jgi:hypothetical protein